MVKNSTELSAVQVSWKRCVDCNLQDEEEPGEEGSRNSLCRNLEHSMFRLARQSQEDVVGKSQEKVAQGLPVLFKRLDFCPDTLHSSHLHSIHSFNPCMLSTNSL